MFSIIFKKQIEKLIKEAYMKGFNNGLDFGIKYGRMQAGDKGIIVSCRVQQEVEEILKNKGA